MKADQTSSSSSHIVDSTEFLELTMSVSGWYANPANRVKHELVSIGDLCAMMCGNSFQRYSCDLLLVCMHKENYLEKCMMMRMMMIMMMMVIMIIIILIIIIIMMMMMMIIIMT